jgi:hypothetical protein
LQRCAGGQARSKNSGYGQPKGVQNHSQVDDLWARFEVPEWSAFCHTERLRNRPEWLKLVLSDSARQGQAAQMPERPTVQAGWNRQKRMPKTGMCPQPFRTERRDREVMRCSSSKVDWRRGD